VFSYYFNPRPRAGSDPPKIVISAFDFNFNPRPRAGSDRSRYGVRGALFYFNPRPRAGSDRCAFGLSDADWRISIHAPERGATHLMIWYHHFKRISIHAPERGATAKVGAENSATKISIHAPERGATPPAPPAPPPEAFQSTPPSGERPGFRVGICLVDHISIHAPERGATARLPKLSCRICYFNPRPRAGSDPRSLLILLMLMGFQSTPPSGERREKRFDVAIR